MASALQAAPPTSCSHPGMAHTHPPCPPPCPPPAGTPPVRGAQQQQQQRRCSAPSSTTPPPEHHHHFSATPPAAPPPSQARPAPPPAAQAGAAFPPSPSPPQQHRQDPASASTPTSSATPQPPPSPPQQQRQQQQQQQPQPPCDTPTDHIERAARGFLLEEEGQVRGSCMAAMAKDRLRLAEERASRRRLEDGEMEEREELEDVCAAGYVRTDLLFSAGLDLGDCVAEEGDGRDDIAQEEFIARKTAEHAHATRRFAIAAESRSYQELAEHSSRELAQRAELEDAERCFRQSITQSSRGEWLRARARELKGLSHAERMRFLEEGSDTDLQAEAADQSLEVDMMRQHRELRDARRRDSLLREAEGALQQQRHEAGLALLVESEREELAGHEAFMRLRIADTEARDFLHGLLHLKQLGLFEISELWARCGIEDLRSDYIFACLYETFAAGSAGFMRERVAEFRQMVSRERSEWLVARSLYTTRIDAEQRAKDAVFAKEESEKREAQQRFDLAVTTYIRAESDDRSLALAEERRCFGGVLEAANASIKSAVEATISRQIDAEIAASTLTWTPGAWEALETHRAAAAAQLHREWLAGVREMEASEIRCYIHARSDEVRNEVSPYQSLYSSGEGGGEEGASPAELNAARHGKPTVKGPAVGAAVEAEGVVGPAGSACLQQSRRGSEQESLQRAKELRLKWAEEQYQVEMNRIEAMRAREDEAELRRVGREEKERAITLSVDAAVLESEEGRGRKAVQASALRRVVEVASRAGVRHALHHSLPTARPASAPVPRGAEAKDAASSSGSQSSAALPSVPGSGVPVAAPQPHTAAVSAHIAILTQSEETKRALYHSLQIRYRGVIEKACRNEALETLFPNSQEQLGGMQAEAPPTRPDVAAAAADAPVSSEPPLPAGGEWQDPRAERSKLRKHRDLEILSMKAGSMSPTPGAGTATPMCTPVSAGVPPGAASFGTPLGGGGTATPMCTPVSAGVPPGAASFGTPLGGGGTATPMCTPVSAGVPPGAASFGTPLGGGGTATPMCTPVSAGVPPGAASFASEGIPMGSSLSRDVAGGTATPMCTPVSAGVPPGAASFASPTVAGGTATPACTPVSVGAPPGGASFAGDESGASLLSEVSGSAFKLLGSPEAVLAADPVDPAGAVCREGSLAGSESLGALNLIDMGVVFAGDPLPLSPLPGGHGGGGGGGGGGEEGDCGNASSPPTPPEGSPPSGPVEGGDALVPSIPSGQSAGEQAHPAQPHGG